MYAKSCTERIEKLTNMYCYYYYYYCYTTNRSKRFGHIQKINFSAKIAFAFKSICAF